MTPNSAYFRTRAHLLQLTMCFPTARTFFSKTPLVVGPPPRVLSRAAPGLPHAWSKASLYQCWSHKKAFRSLWCRSRTHPPFCSTVCALGPPHPLIVPPTLRSTTLCSLPSLRSQGQLLRRHPRGQALRQRAAAEVRFASSPPPGPSVLLHPIPLHLSTTQ